MPKPPQVQSAVNMTLRGAANPGRSGHKLSLAAAEKIYSARKTTAGFFGMEDETRVIFTSGCTMSLNMAIKGLMKSGGHAVVSSMEHNAVMRPLKAMERMGVTVTKAEVFAGDDDRTVDSFRRSINAHTKMIVCTQASNVWGIRLPVERLCALAHVYGLYMIVDVAQSAGVVPIDMKDGYDIVCAAGHKGLYGTMGTGLMLLSESVMPETIIEGGTGSNSADLTQPGELPDRFESGTPNLPGIAALGAGIEFVKSKGIDRIARHEFRLMERLYEGLSGISGIRLYTAAPENGRFVPVVSFNVDGHDSEEVGEYLSKSGIAVRAGLHCAPAAHEAMGTLQTGTVRVSPSAFTTTSDIDKLINAMKNCKRFL